VIPGVNPDHLSILERQKNERKRSGFIVTNPNCSTIELVQAVKPLYDECGITSLRVVTMQAVSGGGYPGVASLDILGNVKPGIDGEAEKMETETKKLLGSVSEDGFEYSDMYVSAQCNRVPVRNGHLESVFLEVGNKARVEEAIHMLESYTGEPQELNLPTAPARPLKVFREKDRPQPLLDCYHGDGRAAGMVVCIGNFKDDGPCGYKFIVLGHNTIRGAAGAAILNAELLEARGYLR
jgi:aspartate-semialdehyde dehydrogenase